MFENWRRKLARKRASRPGRVRPFTFQAQLEELEPRRLFATRIWSGRTSNTWSTPTNWVGDVAPVANDDLVFPSGAQNTTPNNDFPPGTQFRSLTFQVADYVLGGNAVELGVGGITVTGSAVTFIIINFGLNLPGTPTIAIQPASAELNLNGVLRGVGGVIKAGPGTLEFNGPAPNTYLGTTTVREGSLRLRKPAGVTAIAGPLVIGDGAGSDDLVEVRTSEQIDDNVPVTIRNQARLYVSVFTETIGTLTMTGGTAFTGPGAQTVLRLAGNVTATSGPSLAAVISGNLDLGAATRTFTMLPGGAGPALNITARIRGNPGAGLIKNGPAELALAPVFQIPNDFTGTTTVQEGTLSLRGAQANAISGPLVIGDGIGGPGADRVRLDSNNDIDDTVPVTITESGRLEFSGEFYEALGSLTMTGSSIDTRNGALSLGGDLVTNPSSQAATISGQLSLSVTRRNLNIADGPAASDLIINAGVSGVGGINKLGAGTLVLTATNIYTGGTTVAGGTLAVGNNRALGDVTGVLTLTGGSRLQAITPVALANAYTVTGAATLLGTQPLTLTGIGTLTSGAALTVNSAPAAVTLAGSLNGPGATNLIKTGNGSLTLTGTNSFFGTTQVNDGGLFLNSPAGNAVGGSLIIGDNDLTRGIDLVRLLNNNQIADAVSVTVNNSGQLEFGDQYSSSFSDTIGSLTMTGGAIDTRNGTLGLNGDLTTNPAPIQGNIGGRLALAPGNHTFNVAEDAPPIDLAINAVIRNAIAGSPANLIKAGGGTLALNAVNTYTGTTTVAGGTLSGRGEVGNVVVPSGGRLRPGAVEAGILTAKTVEFRANSIFEVRLGGTQPGAVNDQLVADSVVILTGSRLVLTLTPGFVAPPNFVFPVIQDTRPPQGRFADLPEGALYNFENRVFRISYRRSVVLETIQLPTTAAVNAPPATVFGQPLVVTGTIGDRGGYGGGFLRFTANAILIIDGFNRGVALPQPQTGAVVFPGLANLSVGTHMVTVSYPGDPNFTGSNATANQSVTRSPTSTNVRGEPNPATFGNSVTFIITVTAAPPGGGIPAGQVILRSGGADLGTATLTGGQASLATTALPAGAPALDADYVGDGSFLGSAGTVTQTVNPLPNDQRTLTDVTLNASDETALAGQPLTYIATVRGRRPGGRVPTGSVTFRDGNTVLGTVSLDGAGVARFSTATLALGVHAVSAEYLGDGGYLGTTRALANQRIGRDAIELFLYQLYPDLFRREADPGGFNAWTDRLRRGTPRQDIVNAFVGSVEYYRGKVGDFYRKILDRGPDPVGQQAWVHFLSGGGTEEQMEVFFYGSREYFQRNGGSNVGFVNAIYRDILTRGSDDVGRTAWVRVLDQGTAREAVADAFLSGREVKRVLAISYYTAYLRRQPDQVGLTAFEDLLVRGFKRAQIVAIFVGSEEYFRRL